MKATTHRRAPGSAASASDAASDPDPRGPYGVVYRRLWHRSDFRALTFEAKAVYLYAKTCAAGGLVGIFTLRPEDVRDDLGLGPKLAERALRELEAAGFIRRHRAWVWIVDALATTPGISTSNRNHVIAAQKALAHVPDNLADACRNLYGLNGGGAIPIEDPIADPMPDGMPDHVSVAVDVAGDGDGDNGSSDGEEQGSSSIERARRRAGAA